jgi:hypothetical protein
LLGSDDLVVALIQVAFVVKQSGISVEEENEATAGTSTPTEGSQGSATTSTPISTGQLSKESTSVTPTPVYPRRRAGVPLGDDLVVKLDLDPAGRFQGLARFADDVVDQLVNSVRSELLDRLADRVQIDVVGDGVYEQMSLKGSVSFHQLA